MAKKRSNDPASVEWMYGRLRVDTAHAESSFYKRMMGSVLYRLALNRIEWTGLPPEIDPVLIERLLIQGKTLALYKPTTISEPILYSAVGSGSLNYQELPSSWYLQSLNGMDTQNGVPFKDVALLDPRHERMQVNAIIAYYVDLFDSFDQALKSNLKMQKTPVMVIADEEMQLTLANIVDQYQSGAPTIYTLKLNGQSLKDQITALNFNVDYVGDRILIDRRQAWNDCMTYLGIDNSNQDKRERLVRAEISGNDDQIDNARLVELVPRRHFADQLNRLYDWNVEVNWTNDYPSYNHMLANDEGMQAELGAPSSDRVNTDIKERI